MCHPFESLVKAVVLQRVTAFCGSWSLNLLNVYSVSSSYCMEVQPQLHKKWDRCPRDTGSVVQKSLGHPVKMRGTLDTHFYIAHTS
jgi:hypothetical protein